jgi:tetratricopeptide (TPR) repeat protein
MNLALTILLTLAAVAFWWLSGFDSLVTGENRRADLTRRTLRCGATLILLVFFYGQPLNYFLIPLLLIIPITLALMWRGCLSELGARWALRLVDSDDQREFDPRRSERDVHAVANLLKAGRNEEALKLSETLKKSGDANILVLEALLAREGISFDTGRKVNPLAVASGLCLEGKFTEAESVLNSVLAEKPSNLDAALMLMRLCVQDLGRIDKASDILRALEKQPHIPASHIEYARRSIHEWEQPKPVPEKVVLPETVEELLAAGYFGTAVEMLERKLTEQPDDFDSWLKLAEAHSRHSGNHHKAVKLVHQLEAGQRFTAEQIQSARTKLAEWRQAHPGPV